VDEGLGIEERSSSVAIREEHRLRSSKALLTDGQEGGGVCVKGKEVQRRRR
jgi:hypothetical protein